MRFASFDHHLFNDLALSYIQNMPLHPKLQQAVRYFLLDYPGHRFRARFLYDIGIMMGGGRDLLIRLALALECLHTYSLIHDDLPCIDNDSIRRHVPSCHNAYGESLAILAGDALQAMSGLIADDGRYQTILAQANLLMIQGQAMDLDSSSSTDMSQLEHIYTHKTAALFLAAVNLALEASSVCSEFHDLSIKNAWLDYGLHIGLAFQHQDEWCDQASISHHIAALGHLDQAHRLLQHLHQAHKLNIMALQELMVAMFCHIKTPIEN